MAYLHPVLGILSVLLMSWVALNGLRARHRARYAGPSRRLHRRIAPWVFGMWWVTLATGWASTLWLRPDVDPGSTRHFVAAWTSAAVFTAAAVLGLWVRPRPWTLRLHPWLGLAGVAIALTLAVLGMTLLP